MPTRREFLSQTTAAGGALALGAPRLSAAAGASRAAVSKPLSVLVLGGTGFIGPYFVRAAVERGHKVAVFNRGKSQADLPPAVERLVGDRNEDLRSIQSRDWDAVLDLSVYGPAWVRSLGEALQQRVRHYTFISTIDVYQDPSANSHGTDESSPTLTYEGPDDPYSSESTQPLRDPTVLCAKEFSIAGCRLQGGKRYGSLKMLCEAEAQRQFPGRTLIVRPGYMVGPGDAQERFTFWLARMEKGGDILAPGDPLQPVQFIDVRDVAQWIVGMAERNATGVYNALGPAGSMSMAEMLGGMRSLFGVPMNLHWVSLPWIGRQSIIDQEALEWSFWQFTRDDDIVSDKAHAMGLTCRPLHLTASDVLAWYRSLPAEQRTGMKFVRQKAAERLAMERVTISWEQLIEREQAIIARWQAHKARIT